MVDVKIKNVVKSKSPVSFDLADKTGITLCFGQDVIVKEKLLTSHIKKLSEKGMLKITPVTQQALPVSTKSAKNLKRKVVKESENQTETEE